MGLSSSERLLVYPTTYTIYFTVHLGVAPEVVAQALGISLEEVPQLQQAQP